MWVYAYLNCIGLPQKLLLNDVVRECLCDVLCDLLLCRELVHSIRPFAIRRPARVGFYSVFPRGNFNYVSYVYIYLEFTYSGMYVHIYIYTHTHHAQAKIRPVEVRVIFVMNEFGELCLSFITVIRYFQSFS